MHLLVISLFLLFQSASTADVTVPQQSKVQARQYVQNIESGKNLSVNLWALSALSSNNDEIKQYIAHYLSNASYKKPIYRFFRDTTGLSQHQLLDKLAFETGSPQLLIALLLSTPGNDDKNNIIAQFEASFDYPLGSGVNYSSLIELITTDQKINANVLPIARAPFLHFLFLYKGTAYLSTEYVNQFTSQWNTAGLASNKNSLIKSFRKAALVRANFILDLHQENLDLFDDLISDSSLPVSSYRLNLYRAAFYSIYRLGYYDKGLEIIRSFTLPLSQYLNREDVELNALMSQAVSYYNIGRVKESQRINLQVLEEAENKAINIDKSGLLNNIGISYCVSGEFNKYLDLQFKALQIAEEQNHIKNQLSILKNLYIYYINVKETQSALFYLDKAKELALASNNYQELGNIYISIGIFQRDFNNSYNNASQAFERADSLIDKKTDYTFRKNLLYEKAKLCEYYKNYDSALELHQQIKRLTLEKENQSSYLEALVDEARIHLLKGEVKQSQHLIAEIQAIPLETSDFVQIVKAKTVEADYLFRIGEPEQAYEILHPVIEQVVPRAKASTSLESGFWNIEPEYLNAFDVMVNLLIDTGRQEEAIEVLDELKTINDPALYQNPMVKSSLLNESELTQYQRLTNELDALRKQQLVASADKKSAIKRRIDELGAQKQALDQKISQLTTRSRVSLNDVQSQLTASEVVLHITELNDWYYIGKISKRTTEINKIRLDSTARSTFKKAITNLSSGKTNLNQLYAITKLLDINSFPEWIETITIVPDSYLFELPIDILPLTKPDEDYSYGEVTYLVERFNTHYVTSINDFVTTPDSKTDYSYDFAGYGISNFNSTPNKKLIPLPFAKSEVRSISENLTNLANRKSFLDSASSESNFKTSAPKAKILHLATHSEISEQDPLYSTIYMSSDSDNSDSDFPGQIFAYELFELNLNNELIMLNSCESGSGSYLQGTGIMGISRALRYAGAKSLVLNLWSVNDMVASEFAIKFYEYLNEGKSKTEALQLTKIHFIKTKNANPHYWGPYMLIGEKSPVIEPYTLTNTYFAASFMLYFVLFLAFSLFKDQTNRRTSL